MIKKKKTEKEYYKAVSKEIHVFETGWPWNSNKVLVKLL